MLLLGFLLALTAAWQVLSTPVHHAAEQPAPIVSRFAPGATYAQGWGTTQLWLDTLSVTEDFLKTPAMDVKDKTRISGMTDAFTRAVSEAVAVQGGYVHVEGGGPDNFRAAVTQYIASGPKDTSTQRALAEQLHALRLEVERVGWLKVLDVADKALYNVPPGLSSSDVAMKSVRDRAINADLHHVTEVTVKMMRRTGTPFDEAEIEWPGPGIIHWYMPTEFIPNFFPDLAPEEFLMLDEIKQHLWGVSVAPIIKPIGSPEATNAQGWEDTQVWLDTIPVIDAVLDDDAIDVKDKMRITRMRDAFADAVAEAVAVQRAHVSEEGTQAEYVQTAVTQYIAIGGKDGPRHPALAMQLHALRVEVERVGWLKVLDAASNALRGGSVRDAGVIEANLHFLLGDCLKMRRQRGQHLGLATYYVIPGPGLWYQDMRAFIRDDFPHLAPEEFVKLRKWKQNFSNLMAQEG